MEIEISDEITFGTSDEIMVGKRLSVGVFLISIPDGSTHMYEIKCLFTSCLMNKTVLFREISEDRNF